MQKQHRLTVEEDGVDVFVGARRLLAGCGHLERSQETRDQHLQLLHVLFLCLHHAEHKAASTTNQMRYLVISSRKRSKDCGISRDYISLSLQSRESLGIDTKRKSGRSSIVLGLYNTKLKVGATESS